MNNVLMRLENVSRTYIMGEVKVEALKDISLDIYEGELLVILGPSGSGKSTMLNLIGGMDLPTSGRIIYGPHDLTSARDDVLTKYRRNEVGFIFQFYNLIPDLTASENVELSSNLVDNPEKSSKVLEVVGLKERAKHFPTQLSGGEQQRVSIARALVKNPRMLLCDEPTGALDDQNGIKILGLLAEIQKQRGSTVIIVTHNSAIAPMANRVIRMRSGCIAEVIANPNPLPPERIEW